MSTLPPCQAPTLGLMFRQVRDAMWARMEQELAATGHALNFSQFITLKELAINPGVVNVGDLARVAQLHPGAMTRLLDKLEARGLIERSADPADRRALHINLTPAGQAMWDEIHHCGQRVHNTALQGLTDVEQAQLMRLLDQVRDNLTSTPL